MGNFVVVSFDIEGTHYWSGCPFDAVSYLRQVHRHLFRVIARKAVVSLDREVEIILFKRQLFDYLYMKYRGNFGELSCEMIATELVTTFQLASCTVLEDGENGAEVTS